jgi:hypothetical protein
LGVIAPESDGYRRYPAIVDLVQLGLGKDNPVWRRLFTTQFVSGRERQILAAVVSGRSNSQIGAALLARARSTPDRVSASKQACALCRALMTSCTV